MPRQKICKPPKNADIATCVAQPFGVEFKNIFSYKTSMPSPKLKSAIKNPKTAIILKGTILNEVIPFRASPNRLMKLNFDFPNILGLTSKLTYAVFSPISWKNPRKKSCFSLYCAKISSARLLTSL